MPSSTVSFSSYVLELSAAGLQRQHHVRGEIMELCSHHICPVFGMTGRKCHKGVVQGLLYSIQHQGFGFKQLCIL